MAQTEMPLDGWDTSLPDWADRLRAGQSLFPELPLFQASANKALALFSRFRMPDMPGKPSFGSVCSQWQFDLVEALFGSYDPATRQRKISEFFVLVPKKNGKTPTAAAILLVALILNDRPDAEFYLISASHHIANYSFRAIKGIITADPDIDAMFQVQDHLKRITHRTTGATLAIVSADGDIVTGSKASGILIDEMHVLGAKPRADQIMAELRGGFAARPEGFLLTITTQSKEPPSGQFLAELSRARRVRDGEEKAPLLPVLYEFPPDMAKGDAWRNPKNWALVNPNMDVSVSAEFLAEQYRKAKQDGPSAMAIFASLHLNIEIGVGLKATAWVGALHWAKACDPGLTLARLIERSEVAVAGIDGGGLDDLLALAIYGRCRETQHWLGWFHAWAHPEVLEQRKEIAPRLMDFERAGDLTILRPDQPVDDIVQLVDYLEQVADAGLLPAEAAIGLDPFGVAALVDEMTLRGITEAQMQGIRQGASLSPAVWGMERKLKDGTFRHGGQPMMDWVLGNAKSEQRGNAVIITKETAGKAKIDPIVAGFNAATLMARRPMAAGQSYLNSAELMVF